MERLEFISHQGKRILVIDLSQTKPGESNPVIIEAQKLIAKEAHGSLLTLTDVSHAHYDMELVQALKNFTAHNKPFVKAGAVVGIEGMMKIIFEGVEKFSGRTFGAFASRQQAEEWLVKQ